MKRNTIFKLIMTLAAVLLLSSCSTKFGLIYNVDITGEGDGNFKVDFPQGSYAMDGKANLELILGDTIPFNQQVTLKSEIIEKNNKKDLEILNAVNDSIAEKFAGHSESGTYDIHITGFVKEIGTGMVFSIDRRITNKEILCKSNAEPYPFIK